MTGRWEVFDPWVGVPVRVTFTRWAAARMAHRLGLDYAPHGQGWTT